MPIMNGYKILYVLIHSIYTIIEFVWSLCTYIWYKLGLPAEETDYLRKRLANISKKPNHVSVILTVEDYKHRDLANLIFWCLATEIPFISFYDFKGNLKKQEEKLKAVVNSSKSTGEHIIWHSEAGMQHKNGFTGRKIHVKIITKEDGRENIVNLTKMLASNKDKNIDIEKIDRCLKKQYEFPDPGLGIICGETLCILDYPPWQVRLTEFSRIKTVSNITFSLFLEQLEMFCKCEQRVGT